MSGEPPVSVWCCGLLGTAISDDGMLERAYAEACATQGIVPGTASYAHCMVEIHQSRGMPPIEVFRGLFPGTDGRAEAAEVSFERSFRAAVERMGLMAMPGAEETMSKLRDQGVRVCAATSLSRRLLGLMLETVGWWRQVDLAICPEDVPRGCPWPDMMLTVMLRLGAEDVSDTAYTGSSAAGILGAKRAGTAIVAGVLTGGHTADRLRAAGATHILEGISELPALLAAHGAGSPALSAVASE